MVNNVSFGYQPSAAYQSGAAGTSPQDPKRTDQTQPREAPASDSQKSDQRTLASRDENRSPPPKETSRSDSSQQRGAIVDLSV